MGAPARDRDAQQSAGQCRHEQQVDYPGRGRQTDSICRQELDVAASQNPDGKGRQPHGKHARSAGDRQAEGLEACT